MRLIDLDPRWLTREGLKIGFAFFSPINPSYRQTCFVVMDLGFKGQLKAMEQAGLVEEDSGNWQACRNDFAWNIEGGIENAKFETITVTPSLDGSKGGLWHGFITNGEIVGGI